ncbi:DUF4190 domain-containing protein [Streptomyces sp. NPDC053048]|uniref:DUF4190 domain-containing protein n=1 Tax=Streptomyces sp. NPDC053048 TaxID=3365694 RepID=UPI0037D2F9EC
MSETDDARPEPRDDDPWAPPRRRVPLDKPAARDVPPPAFGAGPPTMPAGAFPPPAPPVPAPPAPGDPGARLQGVVPPVPPAPVAPGPYGPVAGHQQPFPQPPPYPYPGGQPYGTGPHPYPGGPVPGWAPGWAGPARVPNNGLGVAGLVLGLVGVFLSPSVFLGVLFGVLAIVFGAIGRGKANTGEATNGGQALAGVILGGVALALSALVIVILVLGHMSGDDDGDDDPGANPTYDAYLAEPPSPGPFPAAASR